MKARVYVTLKPGVLDPQGKAVVHGLHALGYEEVADVRVGKFFEIELAADESAAGSDAKARLEEMCDRLLANTVIEDYRVEVVPTTGPGRALSGAGRGEGA